MPFCAFILRDDFACLISVSVFFNLGYYFEIHYNKLLHWIKTYDLTALSLLKCFDSRVFANPTIN